MWGQLSRAGTTLLEVTTWPVSNIAVNVIWYSARTPCCMYIERFLIFSQILFRKICKNCRCSREDHDLHGNESDDGQPIGMLLDSIPRPTSNIHPMTRPPISDFQTPVSPVSTNGRFSGNSGTAYVDDPRTLTDIYGSETDVVLSRVISENIVSLEFLEHDIHVRIYWRNDHTSVMSLCTWANKMVFYFEQNTCMWRLFHLSADSSLMQL